MRVAPSGCFAILALLVASGLLGVAPLAALEVVRGPYLQLGTPTSVVVKWRTDVASDSRVHYGTDPGNLAAFADDPALVTDHEVSVSGLAPDTTYYLLFRGHVHPGPRWRR